MPLVQYTILLHSVCILCIFIHCAIQNTGNQNNNYNNFVRDSTCTWFGVQEYNGSVFWYSSSQTGILDKILTQGESKS